MPLKSGFSDGLGGAICFSTNFDELKSLHIFGRILLLEYLCSKIQNFNVNEKKCFSFSVDFISIFN